MGFTRLYSSHHHIPFLFSLVAYLLVEANVAALQKVSSGAPTSDQIYFLAAHERISDERQSSDRTQDASDEQMRPHFSFVNHEKDKEKNDIHKFIHRKKRKVEDLGSPKAQEVRDGIAFNASHDEFKSLQGDDKAEPKNHRGENDKDGGLGHGLIIRKRAYSFTPMRGRRYQTSSSSSALNDPDYSAEYVELPDFNYMAKNEHFGDGGTAEVSFADGSNADNLKRASYFVPVRGRKNGDSGEVSDGIMERPVLMDKQAADKKYENGWSSIKNAQDFTAKRPYFKSIFDRSHSVLRDLTDTNEQDSYSTAKQTNKQDLLSSPSDIFTSDPTGGIKRGSAFVPLRGRREYRRFSLSHDPVITMYHAEVLAKPESESLGVSPGVWSDSQPREDGYGLTSGKTPYRYKRAYSFTPMRGRRAWKAIDVLGYGNYSPNLEQAERMLEEQMKKKAFHALRGKKQYYANTPGWKRAFHAMRGKKWLQQNEVNNPSDSMRIEPADAELRKSSYSRSDGMEDSGHEHDEVRNVKRSYPEREFSFVRFPQKTRTALVMKRPLSFFAARGKRGKADVIGTTNDLM